MSLSQSVRTITAFLAITALVFTLRQSSFMTGLMPSQITRMTPEHASIGSRNIVIVGRNDTLAKRRKC
jgi:hypothetical protein